MNLVVDDAYEILDNPKKIKIGKVLIRGDSIMLIHQDPLYEFS
jgi:small nuclear ribonucleoprotein (snRNP)-like protein